MDMKNNDLMQNAPAAAAEKPPKRKRHRMIVVVAVVLGAMVVGQLLGGLLVGLLAGAASAALGGLSDGVWFVCTVYLPFLGIDLAILLYTRFAEREIFRSFGAGRGNTPGMFALGLLVGGGMNALCVLAAWAHGDLVFSFGRLDVPFLLFALLAVCIQSGAEELLTRGYMLGALRERYGARVAIIANALLFMLLHLFNAGVTVLSLAVIALVGLAYSLVVHFTGSLWFAVGAHTAWNFTQNLLFGLPNSGIVSASSLLHLDAARDSAFYNAAFGVEGAWPAALVNALLALAALLWARRRRQAAQ